MEFLQNLMSWENLAGLLVVIGGVWSGFKLLAAKIFKAIDEIEDVVTLSADVVKNFADVLNAVVLAGAPDEKTGNIVITAEEWNSIKKEALEVQKSAHELPGEFNEAWAALKAVFKKDGY